MSRMPGCKKIGPEPALRLQVLRAKGNAGLTASWVGHLPRAEMAGLAVTFLLGIYGGFFSRGYVALLTAALIACFRLTVAEAIAVTKVLNVFSSLVATLIFAKQGLINWGLGLSLRGQFCRGVARGSARPSNEQPLAAAGVP
jgi:hypothetical protein